MMNRLEFDEPGRALPRAPLLCGQGLTPEVGPDKKCRCVVGSLVLALATRLTSSTGRGGRTYPRHSLRFCGGPDVEQAVKPVVFVGTHAVEQGGELKLAIVDGTDLKLERRLRCGRIHAQQ